MENKSVSYVATLGEQKGKKVSIKSDTSRHYYLSVEDGSYKRMSLARILQATGLYDKDIKADLEAAAVEQQVEQKVRQKVEQAPLNAKGMEALEVYKAYLSYLTILYREELTNPKNTQAKKRRIQVMSYVWYFGLRVNQPAAFKRTRADIKYYMKLSRCEIMS